MYTVKRAFALLNVSKLVYKPINLLNSLFTLRNYHTDYSVWIRIWIIPESILIISWIYRERLQDSVDPLGTDWTYLVEIGL